MAGGGEKARLAEIGPFRLRLAASNASVTRLRLGDVLNRHQDLASAQRPVADHPRVQQQKAAAQARQFDLDLIIFDGTLPRAWTRSRKPPQRSALQMAVRD